MPVQLLVWPNSSQLALCLAKTPNSCMPWAKQLGADHMLKDKVMPVPEGCFYTAIYVYICTLYGREYVSIMAQLQWPKQGHDLQRAAFMRKNTTKRTDTPRYTGLKLLCRAYKPLIIAAQYVLLGNNLIWRKLLDFPSTLCARLKISILAEVLDAGTLDNLRDKWNSPLKLQKTWDCGSSFKLCNTLLFSIKSRLSFLDKL